MIHVIFNNDGKHVETYLTAQTEAAEKAAKPAAKIIAELAPQWGDEVQSRLLQDSSAA